MERRRAREGTREGERGYTRRRALSLAAGAAGTAGALAGCSVPGSGTPTGTNGRLDVVLENADVRAHEAAVELRDASGEVVWNRTVSVARDGTRRLSSSGHRGTRYAVEVVVADRRVQYTWEPADCPELTYEVAVTRDGDVETNGVCP